MTKLGYVYLTASGKIHNTRNKLILVIVTPDGTNASYADVYDGQNTSEKKIARLRVPATQSVQFQFGDDFTLEKGLYIDFGTNLFAVTVLSEPAK